MADHVNLIGAEDVRAAASRMVSAADEMRSAAGTIDGAVREMRCHQDAFLSAFELILSEHRDRMIELLEDDRKARAGQPVKIVDGLPGSGGAT